MNREETLELLVWLAQERGNYEYPLPYLNEQLVYQKVIDHICEEYGYSQDDLSTYWKCSACGGGQTIGDQICPTCGGAGYDLTPMLQPWLVEDEEEEEQ